VIGTIKVNGLTRHIFHHPIGFSEKVRFKEKDYINQTVIPHSYYFVLTEKFLNVLDITFKADFLVTPGPGVGS
jgi:hypothetical protein